ncbi:MFS transporter, DHA2 family, multidrug resistance protein [Actinoplanes derwentensis]|uniref:MFS transporter, DHA2 family, multidrug resistance protein n=1 Tax=Actinoplanes derwentensis TaxID=113562 RepID=A0A1H1WI73_9ACTN|nr:MFS transporter [Actinoplanes derwentensis]SDS96805.1 MFS transporter, DHA2 family, multidrug resistance protein [Actinoplanes derwentensis]
MVDDLLAILIIAVFYTSSLHLLPLLAALVPLGLFAALVQRRVRSPWLLLPLAAGLVHASGIHATVAGVLLGFMVPVLRRDHQDGPGLAEQFEHRRRPGSRCGSSRSSPPVGLAKLYQPDGTVSGMPITASRRWAALGVLSAAVLLLSIDGTVLALAVPSLTESLRPTAEQILWIGDVYSLALAGLLALAGNLADRFGRKRVLLFGAVAFGLVSLLAAFAASADQLIAARLLLGVAGATLLPSTLSLIRNIFTDPAERTRAIAVWSAAFGAGSAAGPMIGGFLLEHFWWGSVFLINVPVMILVVVTGIFLLPESRDPSPGPFDFPSAALSLLTVAPIVYAIKHLVHGELSPMLAVGIVAGVLFVRRQRRLANPMLDVDLFRNPAFSGAVLANLISIFALVGLLFFFSQYLQFARGFSPLQAGLAELPATIASIVVVLLVGIAIRLGRGRAIAVSLAVAAAGLALVAPAADLASYGWIALCLIPVGLGVGLAMTLAGDAVISAAPPRKAGSVSAVTETANELGVVLGIAVLGSLLTATYRSGLNLPATLPEADRAAATDSLGSALQVLDPVLAETAKQSFVAAMQTTSLVAAAFTAIAALVAWRLIPSTEPVAAADEVPSASPHA